MGGAATGEDQGRLSPSTMKGSKWSPYPYHYKEHGVMKTVILVQGFGLALIVIALLFASFVLVGGMSIHHFAVYALCVGGGFFWGFGVRDRECQAEHRIGQED